MTPFVALAVTAMIINASYGWTSFSSVGMHGVTYAGGTIYDVNTLCVGGVNQGYACDGRNSGVKYLNPTTVNTFCQLRSSSSNYKQFGFGHGVIGVSPAQSCGECAQIRVPRTDGTYNYMLVMMVDTATESMEVGTTEIPYLMEGTQWVVNDRADFDFRIVDCDNTDFGGTTPSTPSSPTPQPTDPTPRPTPAPTAPTAPTAPVSTECGVSDNWGSMKISPHAASTTTQIFPIISNPPTSITSFEIKGKGESDSAYQSCVVQNSAINMWQCDITGGALTTPASVRINGIYIGNNILDLDYNSAYPLSTCGSSTPSSPTPQPTDPTPQPTDPTPMPTNPTPAPIPASNPDPTPQPTNPTSPPVSSGEGDGGSSGCSITNNWGSMTISPWWGSTSASMYLKITNPPASITAFGIKGKGQSSYKDCTLQNANFWYCAPGSSLTAPASVKLNGGSYYGIDIIESMSGSTAEYGYGQGCAVVSSYTEGDEDGSDAMEWTTIFAIIMSCLIGIGLIITGLVCLYKHNKKKKGTAYFEDNADTVDNKDIGDGNTTKVEMA